MTKKKQTDGIFSGKTKKTFFGESLTDKKAEEVLKMIKTSPKRGNK
ncbi:hypothetical protein [Bacillus sp. FJAT-45037]|nr:hypothetical protein [Bacillus sp. FJAT-45037]